MSTPAAPCRSSRLDEVRAQAALHSDSHAQPRVDDSLQLAVTTSKEKGRGAMGKLMRRIEKAAKSPKAKKLEREMVRKAKDPKTQAKISKRFRSFKAKH